MKQTSTGFKEKIFILQPLSKPNLEIKSKQKMSVSMRYQFTMKLYFVIFGVKLTNTHYKETEYIIFIQ